MFLQLAHTQLDVFNTGKILFFVVIKCQNYYRRMKDLI